MLAGESTLICSSITEKQHALNNDISLCSQMGFDMSHCMHLLIIGVAKSCYRPLQFICGSDLKLDSFITHIIFQLDIKPHIQENSREDNVLLQI